MSFKDMILKSGGIWFVQLEDRTKWVIDIDNMMFDNWEWYKSMGTIESEINNIDDWILGNIKIRKISE